MRHPRASIALVAAFATAACAPQMDDPSSESIEAVGPSAPEAGGAETIAAVQHGDVELRFHAYQGGLAVSEVVPPGSPDVLSILRAEGATPLEVYTTITGLEEADAPLALQQAHYALQDHPGRDLRPQLNTMLAKPIGDLKARTGAGIYNVDCATLNMESLARLLVTQDGCTEGLRSWGEHNVVALGQWTKIASDPLLYAVATCNWNKPRLNTGLYWSPDAGNRTVSSGRGNWTQFLDVPTLPGQLFMFMHWELPRRAGDFSFDARTHPGSLRGYSMGAAYRDGICID